MSEREQTIEKIKSLLNDLLKKVADFIKSLEKTDPLEEVIGICEGPPDLVERHDKYVVYDEIFIDTWAWLALANKRDKYHSAARKSCEEIKIKRV